MNKWLFIILSVAFEAHGCAQGADPSAIAWTKEQLKKDLAEKIPASIVSDEKLSSLAKGKCSSPSLKQDLNYPVIAFLSFSAPESTWINLSKELEQCGGAIVIRGLPNNSFQRLSALVMRLIKQGVKSPILINPKLFQQYQVKSVPTIVFTDEDRFDKISGNISLAFAIEKAAQNGETTTAKILAEKRSRG
jgi:type-F conjugative transfer system pilin assembly protein TrbC